MVYHTETILNLAGYELSSKTDLRKRLKGWRAIGQQYKTIQAQYPTAILLGTDRTILSHLLYHARPASVMTWSPQQKVHHHYDLHGMLKQPLDKEFLFVTDKPLSAAMRATFNTSHQLKEQLSARIYPNMIRKYSVYHLQGFTGY